MATHQIEASTLVLDTNCGRHCSADYRVTVPRGVVVNGGVGSGDIDLTGVAGADVETGSGTISVADVVGNVTADASSGDVNARAVTGSVDVETGSGTIEVAVVTPASIKANTGSGDVTLTVPEGGYRVVTTTGSGDQHINVPSDASAANTLEAHTGSGDVTIRPS